MGIFNLFHVQAASPGIDRLSCYRPYSSLSLVVLVADSIPSQFLYSDSFVKYVVECEIYFSY